MLVALVVLAVGLVSLAALTGQMENGTERSRFMGLAAMLATEKLEDLNRWPSGDPNVNSTAAATVGNLSSDSGPVSVTSSAGITDPSIVYFDDVVITNNGGSPDTTGGNGACASGTGAVGETVSTSAGYVTTYHCADGEMPPPVTTASAMAPEVNAISFHRRWTIEQNPTINGTVVNNVRRITVFVQLTNGYMNPPVTFQLSMVRP